eukprot:TRINITY_DN42787_c0_g1_i1.p1 TRINITY_DN42787_c0_g1~~TRINITY_DN42787_c0_g1_i1.p1  ORF type:complete len:252 (+),score=54.68 TRINITY_DN42787_c0_g1_i1:70-825(+)
MSSCFAGCFGGISASPSSVGKVKLCYWPILAKNIAPALAMEIGGYDWEEAPGPGSKGTGDLWAEWLEMKPSTVWGFLPNLTLQGGKTIGSELAILQFLARKAPALAGSNDEEFRISQELMHQSEEIYQKMTAKVPTAMAKDKSADEFKKFWEGSDKLSHSNAQGLLVYLDQLEDFYKKCGGSGAKFTSTGTTVGEIKLFATLYLCTLIQPDVLAKHSNVNAFVKNFLANPKAKVVMDEKMKGKIQYFIAPP